MTETYEIYENGFSSCCGAKVLMGEICEDCGEHCSADEELEENK